MKCRLREEMRAKHITAMWRIFRSGYSVTGRRRITQCGGFGENCSVYRLLLQTGMREQEAMYLEWSDIDPKRKICKLQSKQKG